MQVRNQPIYRRQNLIGFTLIEILIVLVIVGILISFAYPAYRQYILSANRVDAMSALTQDQTIFERCYAQNFSYSATCAARPSYPRNSEQNLYSISVSNLTATTFTLTATAIGNQTKDTKCRSFSLNQANQKTAVDSSGANQDATCWNL
ncbi:MAG: type IV pilin [Legionellaceae bacterium]|nr:type IV pilin [Legionellaceae bacterium]HCA89707.1 type IV pilin [Legionellales bacterium]|tara:strand:- start:3592 stop:4038 length:447 start_codon:yes stop_codon:yes gene_type:complete